MKRSIIFIIVVLAFAFIAARPVYYQYWRLNDDGYIAPQGTRKVAMAKPTYEHTTDAGLTEAQCNGAINTNQGASAEVDLTLYESTQGNPVMFRQEEAQVMEIGPETNGYIILDGVALDQNDCVDSDGATIGSWMICTRGKNASGAEVWFCDSDGLWVDTGASD